MNKEVEEALEVVRQDPDTISAAERAMFTRVMAFVESVLQRGITRDISLEDAATSAAAVLAFHLYLAENLLGIPIERTRGLQNAATESMEARLVVFQQKLNEGALNKRPDLN